MRNKGFFWFFTILLMAVCVYQLSFSFISISIKQDAERLAEVQVDSLQSYVEREGIDSVMLPNGTYVNFKTEREAEGLAKSAFLNKILKEKRKQEVFLGNTFEEVEGKSVALGLDLVGGMSVTLQLSMPDVVKNAALNPNSLYFKKTFDAAVQEYNTKGGNFVDLFVKQHEELYPDRPLIREFSTSQVVSKITNKATDDVVVDYLKKLTDGALDGVKTIMLNRINQFGVAQPNVTKDANANRLYIELPGVKDQATVKDRLQSTANLEFYLTYTGQDLGNFFNELLVESEDQISEEKLDDLFADSTESTEEDSALDNLFDDTDSTLASSDSTNTNDATTSDTTETPTLSPFAKLFQVNINQEGQFRDSPMLGFAKALDTPEVNDYLVQKAKELMLDNIRFAWGANPADLEQQDTLFYTLYALKIPDNFKARVGGTDIVDARVSFDPNQGGSGVSVEMNNRGAEEWAQMTTENVGNFIAITMDNRVFSAPVINGAITGGNTLISGNFTVKEAQALTDLLNAGSLPAPVVIVDEAVVGPTIGAQNAQSGLISFAVALVLVLIYMLFYYGRAGLVANFALLLNLVFIFGFLAAFGAVLTLSGIAGIVLTIGMSVDANVLIFERAREEIRNGKGMKLVIKDGYKNALSSILDGNITTLLVAVVLKIYGSGPIESFATTLIIGIFCSVFSAVVITRLVFEYQLKKKKSFTFATSFTKNAFTNVNIQFIKNRKKFYIVSGILILISIIALSTKGLKPSVEFTGGRTYEVLFTKKVATNLDVIKNVLRDSLRNADAPVSVQAKIRNSDYRVEITTNYLKGVSNSGTKAKDDAINALMSKKEVLGIPTIESSRSISAAISDEIQTNSMISIFLSMIITFVYVLIRFGTWQFGMGAVISLAHDITIVLGIFAILGGLLPFNMEIDQAFIAAILTIVGYSINDTVIVFDRIREYNNKYHHKSRLEVINEAINSTLGRTINTSGTTFVVLLIIFIFGGGSIKAFVFGLMIGVAIGTFSSVTVASPVMYDFSRKGDKLQKLADKKKK